MYSMEDMLKMLDGGESADSLAKSFTDVLNAAIQEKKRVEADEAKRKAEAEAKRQKVAEASKILDAVFVFGEKYYPEIFEKNMRGSVSAAGLVKAMDQARDDVMRIMPQLEKAVSNLDWVLPTSVNSQKIAATESKAETGSEKEAVEDPIMKFLKSYDLF